MYKGDSWQYSVALACLIIGILISIQFKTQKSKGFPLYRQRTEELIKIINGLEIERNKLRLDLEEARVQIKAFQETTSKGETLLKSMNQQIEKMTIEAGFVGLEGPGIEVTLSDSARRPKVGEDPYFYLVHDVELEPLVNELKASGAEAISINDQRIVSTTAIRCAGPTVFINSERMSPPYAVRAIGPSRQMETTLKMQGGYLASMDDFIKRGVRIDIIRKEVLVVPAFKGSLIMRYAKPVKN